VGSFSVSASEESGDVEGSFAVADSSAILGAPGIAETVGNFMVAESGPASAAVGNFSVSVSELGSPSGSVVVLPASLWGTTIRGGELFDLSLALCSGFDGTAPSGDFDVSFDIAIACRLPVCLNRCQFLSQSDSVKKHIFW
jgi:hypothetical protein